MPTQPMSLTLGFIGWDLLYLQTLLRRYGSSPPGQPCTELHGRGLTVVHWACLPQEDPAAHCFVSIAFVSADHTASLSIEGVRGALFNWTLL